MHPCARYIIIAIAEYIVNCFFRFFTSSTASFHSLKDALFLCDRFTVLCPPADSNLSCLCNTIFRVLSLLLLVNQRPPVFFLAINQPHIDLLLQNRYGTVKLNGRHPGIHLFFLGMHLNLVDCPDFTVLVLHLERGGDHLSLICKPTIAAYFPLFSPDRSGICLL